MRIVLNRLRIIGNVSDCTPTCVIAELAACLGIKFCEESSVAETLAIVDKMIDSTVDIGHELTRYELSKVAQFVNPTTSVVWETHELMLALGHLLQFYEKIGVIEPNFESGQKTPKKPMAYNACMLFAYLRHHGVCTSRSTTFEQLEAAVRCLFDSRANLREHLFATLADMDLAQLVSLKLSVSQKAYPSEDLSVCLAKFSNPEYLITRAVPKHGAEAIALAALRFRVDVSESTNPTAELASLAAVDVQNWQPVDSRFRQSYSRNPEWFNIDKTWNPKFGAMYDNATLREFAIAEGWAMVDLNRTHPGELLYQSRITSNIYFGRHPSCTEIVTGVDRDDVTPRMILLTYGNIETNSLKLYTEDELCRCFMHYSDFVNPLDTRETMAPIVVRKLLLLCSSHRLNDLSQTIATITARKKSMCEHAKQLAQERRKNEKCVDAFLDSLLRVAYYMRGWKVATMDLPIDREKTQFPANRQSEVDLNVCDAIRELYSIVDAMPEELAMLCRSLPLMQLKKSGNSTTFVASSNADYGLTIFDRLSIVTSPGNNNSCIRMASNRFASSGYYYSISCGRPAPFELTALSDIS